MLYDSQCGEFRDTTLELIKIYDKKHEIKKLSQSITLSGKELVEFGKLYADEVECKEINFLIRNIEDEAETKKFPFAIITKMVNSKLMTTKLLVIIVIKLKLSYQSTGMVSMKTI